MGKLKQHFVTDEQWNLGLFTEKRDHHYWRPSLRDTEEANRFPVV